MKKVTSLFIVVCLVCLLAVPCFAYDYNGTNLSSHILFDGELIPLYEWYVGQGYPDMVLYAHNIQGTYRLYVGASGSMKVIGDQLTCSSTYYIFDYDYSNGYWLFNDSLNEPSTTVIDTFYLRWSARDLYNNEGTLKVGGDSNFRQPPLPEAVMDKVEEDIPQLHTKVLGIVKICLICGISLMASLVCFVILKPLLKRFGMK